MESPKFSGLAPIVGTEERVQYLADSDQRIVPGGPNRKQRRRAAALARKAAKRQRPTSLRTAIPTFTEGK